VNEKKTYIEYAVIVNDGPSLGFVIRTQRSRRSAEQLRNALQRRWEEELVVKQRSVTVSDWETIDRADEEKTAAAILAGLRRRLDEHNPLDRDFSVSDVYDWLTEAEQDAVTVYEEEK